MQTTIRENNFNFMRLVFALLVILGHSPELVDGNQSREVLMRIFGTMTCGGFAVDGFFLLSGYLIMQSWERQPDGWKFLKKRLLRIYPGFIVASLICAFVVGPLAGDSATYFQGSRIRT
jgi:peptidoglycan/LPS O-acetylase OafA/YrhL